MSVRSRSQTAGCIDKSAGFVERTMVWTVWKCREDEEISVSVQWTSVSSLLFHLSFYHSSPSLPGCLIISDGPDRTHWTSWLVCKERVHTPQLPTVTLSLVQRDKLGLQKHLMSVGPPTASLGRSKTVTQSRVEPVQLVLRILFICLIQLIRQKRTNTSQVTSVSLSSE